MLLNVGFGLSTALPRNVYPGFVEAHCHLGVHDYGMGFEGADYNEMGDTLSPQLRGLDSYYPQDKAIPLALHAGVTTVCTGPGSANVLGGTFLAVKTHGDCVDDILIKPEVAMKCAFGENPKRCYRDKGTCTRMTTAAKLREILYKAKEYGARRAAAGDDITKGPSFDMKLEALQPVLRGEIPLKAHAHRADDICTAIRIAKEFGGAHHRALHRGSPDCGSAGPGGLSCGGGSHAHQRQQN